MTCVLAIDIGGTKLAAALVDEAGSVLFSATRPTPRTDVMSALAALIAEVTDTGPPPEAVGIGCAGPLDLAAGTVSPVNMPSWRGFPLRDEVQKLVGLPTMLAGDAQCFALGEHWLGAGQGCTSLLGIVVSTGIGGGLVLDGAPLLGPTGNAGHVGHMSIDPNGERCECGGRGCVERYSSGPNLVRWALENGWSPGAVHNSSEGRSSVPPGNPSDGRPTDSPGEPSDGRSKDLPDAPADGKSNDPPSDPSRWQSNDPHVTPSGGPSSESAGVSRVPGEKADARMLAEDAAAGDPIAVAAFERGARALAGMIASTAAAAEVTTVVIGGGVSGAGKTLFDPLERALDDVAGLAFVRAVQVKQSTLGVRAALAGAANLAWRAVRTPSD
ncbi:ROK family protein [Nonomuraea zeae]|uniref:ROK family protein n=1 Tax=Nonomuraea zeae TaxID=1642303 RepID=UPI001F109933|nr:ROK family protein [Nonomuraea zeae]